jgi:hypothetical protein
LFIYTKKKKKSLHYCDFRIAYQQTGQQQQQKKKSVLLFHTQTKNMVRAAKKRCKCLYCSKECDCQYCHVRRTQRLRAVTAVTKQLPEKIIERLRGHIDDTERNRNVIAAALKQAKGCSPRDSGMAKQVNEMLKSIEPALDNVAFNPEIRWQLQEREDHLPQYTAIMDHTFCEIATKDPNMRSGKHEKYGVKYFVMTTLQGTIFKVIGPFPGIRHDFRTLKSTVVGGSPVPHYENDRWLADGGYQGSNAQHVLVPFKAKENEKVVGEMAECNEIIQHFRARVEHTFGCTKNRFFLFARKARTRSFAKHGQLFKLACLAQSILQQHANRVCKKYDACHNPQRGKLSDLCPRGNGCTCNIFPVTDESWLIS